jgi:hypothetical protein
MFALIRRLADAVLTGLGVVLGLAPDPSRVPIRYDD